jgi:hypothetical protein
MMNHLPARKKVNVIDTSGAKSLGRRIRCENCGNVGVHVYKLDHSLLFCPDCCEKVPIGQAKQETEAKLGIAPINTEKTFITQVKRRSPSSNGYEDGRNMVRRILKEQGYDVVNYYEIY